MARVLVVDDELDLVRVVVKLMEARGHRVTTAKDGAEALARIATDCPDLLILDANIPKIDGAEVSARLKADPATRDLPIVMMTQSYVGIDEATSRIQLHCDAFVVKPFQGELLADNVDRLLRDR